jgi:hypothetical protein
MGASPEVNDLLKKLFPEIDFNQEREINKDNKGYI